MTDLEYTILDELYFVTTFEELFSLLEIETEKLKNTLAMLIEKGWVKCFKGRDEEIAPNKLEFDTQYFNYAYLATKTGLLAHNQV